MLADLQIIGSNGVPHPAHSVFLLAFDGRIGTHHLTVCDRVGEKALFLLRIVHTKGGANHEVLERSHTQVNIAEHTPLGVFIIFGIVDHAQRILTL